MSGWWVLVIVAVVVGLVALVATQRQRAAQQLAAANDLRKVTRVAEEDVTRFGEELQDLHVETLTTELDTAMRQDYQRALDSYENAKTLLADVEQPADVKEVTKALEDGRYAQACVLARQSGDELPQRLPPCFFNPSHGPADRKVEWAPPGGVERGIPVCRNDAERLEQGAEPDSRMVRRGNKMVPWYQGGEAYRPYADGYFGLAAVNGLFPAFVLGSLLASPGYFPEETRYGDDGGAGYGDGGGGYDGGGGGGGGGDFGGGDFGGGDFGGF